MKKSINTNRGFTIIETLVALIIFASSVTVLLVMAGKGIQDTAIAKNQLTANYLAQEGIELMRFRRDLVGFTNFSSDMNTFQCQNTSQDDQTNQTHSCALSPMSAQGQISTCPVEGCQLYLDTETGSYGLLNEMSGSNYTSSLFRRKIWVKVAEGASDTLTHDSLIVTSTIIWQQGLSTFSSSMSETVYDWQ